MSGAREEIRKRLKELSFAEKIKILEKLRDRSLACSERPKSIALG